MSSHTSGNDRLFVPQLDDITCREFLPSARFPFAVDQHFAGLNTNFRFTAGADHPLVFEKMVKAEGFVGHQ